MIKELVSKIEELSKGSDQFIVAIDGRCSSGKSTLAAELARALEANLIHMDDFFLRPEQRTEERLSTPGENIDHERFLSEVLIPLSQGISFTYRPFSCRTQTLGEPRAVVPTPITIVEGSYACHPSLRDHYHLRIFLTVDPEEQMRRLRARDGAYADVFRTRWIPLEEAYFSACDVRKCCFLTLKYTFEGREAPILLTEA